MVNKGLSVVSTKALMSTILVEEHKDKTITHTVHEVLTWFDQSCLRSRMRDNDSTIQQRILQRTKLDTIIGFPKHPMFPHSCIYTLLRVSRSTGYLSHISIHLVQSLHVHLHLIIFFPHDLKYLQRYFQQPCLFYKEV